MFGISRQAYYKHYHTKTLFYRTETIVLELVREVRKEHPAIGCKKLYVLLADKMQLQNIKLGRDGLFDMLRKHNLLMRKRKRKAITTWSNHPFKKYKNLIKDYIPAAPEQLWVSDITYLRTQKGFAYISLITDAYSRKIVGYELADNLEAINSLSALKMAIKTYKPNNGLIHHSDRGIQYCSKEYIKLLNLHEIRISMTESGDPIENAIAERVNGIIKNEYLLQQPIRNKYHAKELLHKAVRAYNQSRPHLSCNMLTPELVHKNHLPIKRKWKTYYKKQIPVNVLQE